MDNQDELSSLFNKARNEAPHASFTETKGWFLNSLNNTQAVAQKSTQLLTPKKGIIMLSAITITIGFIALIFTNDTQVEQPVYEIPKANIETLAVTEDENKREDINENNTPKKEVFSIVKIQEKPIEIPVIRKEFLKPAIAELKTPKNIIENDTVKPRFALPILTLEQKKAHKEQKEDMLKMWLKKSKKICVKVPAGMYNFKGTQMDIKSFYMQRGEVSNIEYRTFINDLILEGRTEDFKVSIPKQSNWSEIEGAEFDWLKELEGKYSVSSEFDAFPVNNVSREGVNLYCTWLQKQLNSTSSKSGEKELTVRLPFNYEWVYAGTEGGMKKYYSWGWDQAFNPHGCYVANFYIKDVALPASCDCEILGKDAFSSFWWRTGKRLPTSPVTYYWPNKWGLLDMNGNVAEMVNYIDQNLKIGALGGGWLSNADQIKFNAPDPYIGVDQPHLNIGFRVVVE